jgi:hypothetical protein
MELTGKTLLLIIFSPIALIVVLLIFVMPVALRVTDYHKHMREIRNDRKLRTTIFYKNVADLKKRAQAAFDNAEKEGKQPDPEEIALIRNELLEHLSELRSEAKGDLKEINKAYRDFFEEMGFNDFGKILKKDIKDIFK